MVERGVLLEERRGNGIRESHGSNWSEGRSRDMEDPFRLDERGATMGGMGGLPTFRGGGFLSPRGRRATAEEEMLDRVAFGFTNPEMKPSHTKQRELRLSAYRDSALR